MKIIDYDKKGNLVRFFFGKDDCLDYLGDDWDDTPYEHNAGEVYEEYVEGYVDICFPFDCSVMESCDDWRYDGNSPFCKEDLKKRMAPCIVAVYEKQGELIDDNSFTLYSSSDVDNVDKFYFNDPVSRFYQPSNRFTVIQVKTKGENND